MVTLKEVAEKAGVSVATVSRVLNAPEKVKPPTRSRVQAVVQALDYRPSRVARRLRVSYGHSNLLGLVIPDIQNPFFADITRGVEDVAYAHGYALILSNSDESIEKQRLCLDTLCMESVDGVILPPVREQDEDVAGLIERGIPVVYVDRRMKKIRFDTVVSSNEQGAYEAVSLLIRRGHQRIGLIGGIPNISTSKERRQGYEHALVEHGLALDPALIREGDSRHESGYQIARELLQQPHPPTALFTGNNLMTLGALAAIHSLGLRIPDDVAIVGYDDMSWALALNPPLTVVSQPGYEIGRRAAELMLQRIAEPNRSPTLVTLQPRLVVRRSCGSTEAEAASHAYVR